ncbi:KamA family radical SAM protein [Syntrophobacteraceae bacterium DRH4]|nr:KamA family radical SAM protein [Desulfoferrobacter suflitae]MCK8601194.1 KamA family radical SAM protein [Desulfoferrobacter suflitae]
MKRKCNADKNTGAANEETEPPVKAGCSVAPENLIKGCVSLTSSSFLKNHRSVDARLKSDCQPTRKFPINPATNSFRKTFFPGVTIGEWNDWHWQLRHRITDVENLARIIQLTEEELQAVAERKVPLPLAITPYYASLIYRSDGLQALRRTVVPVCAELNSTADEAEDPLGEDSDSPVPGLVHRYPDRVLFLTTDVCSTYCRYCTRSRMVGGKNGSSSSFQRWSRAIEYIQETPSVRDVLLSGGDPLTLSNDRLEWLLVRLRAIPHVEMIRIGTKAPVVLPQRVTLALTRMLRRYHPLWMSVHFTHPNELTSEVIHACNRLADAGIPLGSQTVLLAGINDQVDIMKRLYHGLLKMRVRPYYLYQCDPIPGSAHFRTPVSKGLEIMRGLRGFTSGYAIPAYVIDAPGGGGKVPLLPEYIAGRDGDALVLANYRGKLYRYPDCGEKASRRGPRKGKIAARPQNREQVEGGPFKIGITYDLREEYLAEGYSREETAEFDRPDTIEGIDSTLQTLGFQTDRIGHVRNLVLRLAAGDRWDMVFNIAEGLKGYGREAQVPTLLDAYNIPYTFSDALVLSLSLHKGMTKRVIRDLGIPTADFAVVESVAEAARLTLPFPLFAKPVAEGTGKGISAASKIRTPAELAAVCGLLLSAYQQPVLVETFLPGREFTVGIVGTGEETEAIAVIEIFLKEQAENDAYSYKNKEHYEELVEYRLVNDATARQAKEVAIASWKGLGCRDAGRIDLRVDAHGVPNFIEVNPLAGLNPTHSDLPILCRMAGVSYEQLLDRIMRSALKRVDGSKVHRAVARAPRLSGQSIPETRPGLG